MYYIIETQHRPDGVVNILETGRESFASALSYYYERCSKMCVTELFTSVSMMLVDANLNVQLHETLTTQYKEK